MPAMAPSLAARAGAIGTAGGDAPAGPELPDNPARAPPCVI
jgi:hypothetical protein